ncbi:hypothetical protein GCM10023189_18400 [Nibrella saemangeumensis]|uniref:Uncharacterized protein n=1 Tax=Nibrella saemangeumensis TaxID=1084526 RepID=A0ABP8MR14_9BACT
MPYYVVEVGTPEGEWLPIAGFGEDHSILLPDSHQRMTFEEANRRYRQLTATFPFEEFRISRKDE